MKQYPSGIHVAQFEKNSYIQLEVIKHFKKCNNFSKLRDYLDCEIWSWWAVGKYKRFQDGDSVKMWWLVKKNGSDREEWVNKKI